MSAFLNSAILLISILRQVYKEDYQSVFSPPFPKVLQQKVTRGICWANVNQSIGQSQVNSLIPTTQQHSLSCDVAQTQTCLTLFIAISGASLLKTHKIRQCVLFPEKRQYNCVEVEVQPYLFHYRSDLPQRQRVVFSLPGEVPERPVEELKHQTAEGPVVEGPHPSHYPTPFRVQSL